MGMFIPMAIGAALGAGSTALDPSQRGHWQNYLMNAGTGAAMGAMGQKAGVNFFGQLKPPSGRNPQQFQLNGLLNPQNLQGQLSRMNFLNGPYKFTGGQQPGMNNQIPLSMIEDLML